MPPVGLLWNAGAGRLQAPIVNHIKDGQVRIISGGPELKEIYDRFSTRYPMTPLESLEGDGKAYGMPPNRSS
jgi:hypothetical protein